MKSIVDMLTYSLDITTKLNITIHKMILLPYLLFSFYVHNVSSLLIIVFFRLPCPPLAKRESLPYTQALNPYHRD